MRQHGAFGHSSRAARVLEDRGVLGADVHRPKGAAEAQELSELMLARGGVGGRSVSLAALTREGEPQAEERRGVLLDVRGGHGPDGSPFARRAGGGTGTRGHAGVVVREPRALGRDPDAQPQPPPRYRSTRMGGRRMPALQRPYGSPVCGTSTLVRVSTASRLSDSIAS